MSQMQCNEKKTTKNAKIFVGGFPVHLNEQNLWEYMSKYGEVKGVKILKKNGKSRGFGFVTFDSQAEADHVISIQHRICGKKFDCKGVVDEKQAKREEKQKKERKVFIGGLNKATTEQSLHTYFQRFGEIERAFLNKEHFTDKSRGSGFVLFKSKASVDLVLNSNPNHMIDGEAVTFII